MECFLWQVERSI